MRRALQKHIKPLTDALERREAAILKLAEAIEAFPGDMRTRVKDAVATLETQKEADQKQVARPSMRSVSPGM